MDEGRAAIRAGARRRRWLAGATRHRRTVINPPSHGDPTNPAQPRSTG